MASLPSYVIVHYSRPESFDPAIVQSEVERGLAKLRVGASRVVKQVAVTLLFSSAEDTEAFEDWYFTAIKRIGFFDWHDSRTNVVRRVRFQGGALGELTPMAQGFAVAQRTATLEYLR
ncbi:hypothetical protein [Comamonas sp. lk]|uniref:hypothetical protein n=1 Tax=Comamonas sp. lk TaxID=2201272 RepID=UPI001F09D2C2|nr:hypothetical protein [Comamonas sp. lk]